jgi:hypothetical protein
MNAGRFAAGEWAADHSVILVLDGRVGLSSLLVVGALFLVLWLNWPPVCG